MRPWPVVSALVMSVVLIVLTMFGCLLTVVTGVPSEPCPYDGASPSFAGKRLVVFVLGAALMLLSFTSIVLAWVGVTRRDRRTRPLLLGAGGGLLGGAALAATVVTIMVTVEDCP
ncbi:hypothetical protein [Actinoplanes philippinensis]|uniref:hypothetical protein n=1 Tax=Actinoplanes philippinensis TaxID=35752 RepID=UPI00340F9733